MQVRTIGDFKGVFVYNKIDALIVKGTHYKVEVIAGEHIIHKVSTKIMGDNLVIENYNTCNFVRGYKRRITVKVTTPYLDSVINFGVGKVTIGDNFKQDTLDVKTESSGDIYVHGFFKLLTLTASGNGDMYLNGTTEMLYAFSIGTNYLWAKGLVITDFMYVYNRSLGNSYVNAEKAQRARFNVEDAGNIYYSGHPPLVVYEPFEGAKGKLINQE